MEHTTSTTSNSDDEWNKFADAHKQFHISLDDNDQDKLASNNECEKAARKEARQEYYLFMGSKRFAKLSTQDT